MRTAKGMTEAPSWRGSLILAPSEPRVCPVSSSICPLIGWLIYRSHFSSRIDIQYGALYDIASYRQHTLHKRHGGAELPLSSRSSSRLGGLHNKNQEWPTFPLYISSLVSSILVTSIARKDSDGHLGGLKHGLISAL